MVQQRRGTYGSNCVTAHGVSRRVVEVIGTWLWVALASVQVEHVIGVLLLIVENYRPGITPAREMVPNEVESHDLTSGATRA